MSEGDSSRLEALFHEASDLAPAARDALLRRVADESPRLAARLQALLAHDRPDTPAWLRSVAPTAPVEDPDWIDRYRVLGRIGEGGMGVVYLAEQAEPVRRQVAIKVMRAGLDTEIALARFAAERQALAMMDHPCIARIFDAGATANGRPFYVMEHTPGLPLHTYCDRHGLDVPARLALFVQVCDAVQHAHQRGIVHRDLKPANVLVTTQSGTAIPKVIDFGIARPATARGDDGPRTRADEVVGTFDYMSPEQAAGGGDVDTRTDIWSLGVMLHQLLTGTLPFGDAPLHTRPLAEVRTILQQDEPVRPSTRAAGRPALARALRGDLDWIVLRALAKDRAGRYASASELAAEVRRHLHGEPVLAGPPSWRYRFGKFVRRHRAIVIAAGAVLAALTAGLVGTALGLHRATTERARADERAEALRQQLYATNVALAHEALQRGAAATAARLLADCPADLRGFEWQWLTAAASRPRQRTELPTGERGLCLGRHADGRRVLVGTNQGRLLPVDPDRGTFGDARPIVGDRLSTVTTDASGRVIVVGSDDGSWHRVDPDTLTATATLAAPTEQIRMMAVAPHGRSVALLRNDGAIEALDLATGRRQRFAAPPRPVDLDVLAWSPDGSMLVAGGGDLCRFDVATATCAHCLDEPRRTWRDDEPATRRLRIGALAFAPDGSQLAVGLGRHVPAGDDPTNRCELRLAHDLTLQATVPMRGPGWLGNLAFRRDGRELVGAGPLEFTRVLLRGDAVTTAVPGHEAPILATLPRADGSIVSLSERELCAWPAQLPAMPDTAPTWQSHLPAIWSRSGARVAVPVWLLGGALVQDTTSFAVARALVPPRLPPRVLAITDDDAAVVAAPASGDAVVVELASGRTGRSLSQSVGLAAGCCLGDGESFVGADPHGALGVWRLADGTRVATIPGQGAVTALVPWRDERAVAVGRADGRIERFALDDTAVQPFGRVAGPVVRLVVHPARQLIAVDERATAWVLQGDGRENRRLGGDHVGHLDVSPDGRRVAITAPGGVQWLDFATGTVLVDELLGSRGVGEVRFRRDGSGLVGLGPRLVAWDLRVDDTLAAARETTRVAHRAYQRLRRQHVVVAAMQEHAADERLAPAEHAALLELLTRLGDSAQELNHDAWERVVRPNLPPAEYAYALVAADTAARIAPSRDIRNTLATARLRAGDHAGAAALAQQLLDESAAAGTPVSPFDLAVLTMARWRLGDRAAAAAAMAALRARVEPFLRDHGDPQIRVLLREAEATLAQ